jgi:hypothetical protein
MGGDPAKVARLDSAVKADFLEEMNKLEARTVAFNKATAAGKLMRGLVVAVAVGLNFAGSLKALMDKPDAVKGIRTADLGALALQRTCDLLVSLGVASPTSAVGRYAAATLGDVAVIGRLVGPKLGRAPLGEVYLEIYAILEAANAVRSAFGLGVPQDTGTAIFSGVSAVGFGMTAAPRFGAAALTGWIGMGIAAVAIIGQTIYDGVKDAHKYEKASEICLRAAGFNDVHDVAAAKFSRQAGYLSGAVGDAQIPFLMEYAAFKKMTVVELLTWVTSLAPDQISDLSNDVLKVLDEVAGIQEAQAQRHEMSADVTRRQFQALEMDKFERKLARDKIPIPVAGKPSQEDR